MSRRPRPPDADTVTERLRRHLDVLGLTDTLEHLDEHLAWTERERPTSLAFLERVLGQEAALRLEKRIERRVVASRLKDRKSLEAFDWDFQPKLDRRVILDLARLDFVRRKEDLLITGKAGVGKSHILKAFVIRACQQQITTRYARCVELLDDLFAGLGDGSYDVRLRRWCRPDFLVIDDVGLGNVRKREEEPTAAHNLFNVIERRHGHVATALTSNIRLSQWGRYLGDATLAAAILDRLAGRALRIDIDGPSYRQHLAQMRAKEHGTAAPDDPDSGASGDVQAPP